MRAARRRLLGVAALAGAIGAGLGIHLLAPDAAWSDVAGDALYAVAAYLVVVALAPRWAPVAAAAVVGTWCVAVELFQLTGLPLRAGTAFPPAMLILGTVFDVRDLVVYVVAVALAAGLDALGRRAASDAGTLPRETP
ncbi:DUF2809 domain-containing protein [Microbacterium ulmi]|uniref:DUF2809 domain-containing protein n=1 Tax=Microbacterium ulmi TaxID=179095 RepID=A0A7Y2PZY7_9MICO|nr:DUF2809 domain-containing protein [Microbacterium ulmi]